MYTKLEMIPEQRLEVVSASTQDGLVNLEFCILALDREIAVITGV
jgi:hypothetical protein